MAQWFWSRRWKYEKFTITLTKTTTTDNGLLENISFLKKLMKETSETIVLAPSRTFFLHSHTDNILYTYDRNIQYILNIKRRHFEYSITSKILIRNYIYIYKEVGVMNINQLIILLTILCRYRNIDWILCQWFYSYFFLSCPEPSKN